MCYGGAPANYLENSALDILKAIPATWDETRVIGDSEIGRTAAFARRSGDVWFVGVVNGGEDRPFDVKLDFLGAGSYRADLLGDKLDDNAAWNRVTQTVKRGETVRANLRSNGGFVARFTKIN